MAYTKHQRFEKFAYETIIETIIQSELSEKELESPFLEDVCPKTKINIKNYSTELNQLFG